MTLIKLVNVMEAMEFSHMSAFYNYSAADRDPKKMIPQPAVPHFLTYIKLISGVCSFQNWKLEVSIPMAS